MAPCVVYTCVWGIDRLLTRPRIQGAGNKRSWRRKTQRDWLVASCRALLRAPPTVDSGQTFPSRRDPIISIFMLRGAHNHNENLLPSEQQSAIHKDIIGRRGPSGIVPCVCKTYQEYLLHIPRRGSWRPCGFPLLATSTSLQAMRAGSIATLGFVALCTSVGSWCNGEPTLLAWER